MTPLIPSSEARYVPSSRRPIPGTLSAHHALAESQAAATADEPVTVVDDRPTAESRSEQVLSAEEPVRPNVPPRAAAAATAAQEPPEETASVPEEEEQATATEPQPPTEGEYQAGEEVGTPRSSRSRRPTTASARSRASLRRLGRGRPRWQPRTCGN